MVSFRRLTCAVHPFRAALSALILGLSITAPRPALAVIDVALGEFFNLATEGRIAPLNGLAVTTVSCNVGTERVNWLSPMNPDHPLIAFSLYRIESNQLQQIGISWVKHGFFALDESICTTCTDPNGGTGQFLGVNCSDTYSLSNNSSRFTLGPRSEINPWTADWQPCTSYFANAWGASGDCSQSGSWPFLNAIDHLMIVADNDIDPALHPTALFYTEGMYLVRNDANKANNIGWRRIGVFGSPGSFDFASLNPDGTPMTGTHAGRTPQYGPAINLWGSDHVTLNAGQSPIADDGEVFAATLATNLGGGTWHYEFAVYNYNFDKQVHSFSIPVPSCASVSNPTFRDVPYSVGLTVVPWGQDVTGADWQFSTIGDAATWTDAAGDNPIRWGQLYNFGFDCNRPPAASTITITSAKPSTPSSVSGPLPGPAMTYRKGDLNGDGLITNADIAPFVSVLLTGTADPSTFCAADMNSSGTVNGDDIQPFADALF